MVKKVSGCKVGVGSSESASSRGGGGFFGFGGATWAATAGSVPVDAAEAGEVEGVAGVVAPGDGRTVPAGETGAGAADGGANV